MNHLQGFLLRRASAAAMAELASNLRPLGLRPVEASVLVVIGTNPGATQSEIGRMLNILRANMTSLAIGLERNGLVRRDKADGRSRGLVLTKKGKVLAAKVRRVFAEWDRSMVEFIPRKHRKAFLAALQALLAGYERERNLDDSPMC